MARATAIIGSCFGDEGKGLLTDYICARQRANAVVVRFNGGGQAGHTVTDPFSHQRHVFHHFGAGGLLGIPTFLSRFFVVNPIIWKTEEDVLLASNRRCQVFIDPAAPLSTHYDMLINRALEQSRGANRHGSCGSGINETIVRARDGLATTAADLWRPGLLRQKLLMIRNDYVPRRLAMLDLSADDPWLQSDTLFDSYMACAERMSKLCTPADMSYLADHDRHLVFEGAQGLLLDEDHKFFPHVTRSKTGLRNAAILAAEIGVKEIEAIYVMRAYMTRHGNGPFPTADAAMAHPDPTNRPNDWQGTLRFGQLDLDLIREAILDDIKEPAKSNVAVTAACAITCLDQTNGMVHWQHDGETFGATITDFARLLAEVLPIREIYTSYGPTRDDVRGPRVYAREAVAA